MTQPTRDELVAEVAASAAALSDAEDARRKAFEAWRQAQLRYAAAEAAVKAANARELEEAKVVVVEGMARA